MTNLSRHQCIGIFARSPQHGQVKTRIAKDLGDDAALTIYKQLLIGTLQRAAETDANLYLWATDTTCTYLRSLAEEFRCELKPQSSGDLGEKMQSAMGWMLSHHRYAALIGSDCLLLTPARLEASLAVVERKDVGIVPAEDGGFVLIAASNISGWGHAYWRENGRDNHRACRPLFHGARWSSEHTLSDTLNCLHEAGAQVTILETLWDVDTAADVRRAVQAKLLVE